MKSIVKEINDAILNGEVLSIIYHAGSKPGAKREIIPIQQSENGKVRARCYSSNLVKTFMIEKIEILSSPILETSTNLWQHTKVHVESEAKNVSEVAAQNREEFCELGWKISETQISEEGFSLGLHRPKKRGSGYLKYSELSISYTKYRYILVAQKDGSISEEYDGISQKPWCVAAPGRVTRNWKHYGRALEAFLEEALKGPS